MIFIPMAAYSIARNMSKRKAFTIMYTLLILGIFVPFQVIMIPITVMMSKLGLANYLWFDLALLDLCDSTDPLSLCRVYQNLYSRKFG